MRCNDGSFDYIIPRRGNPPGSGRHYAGHWPVGLRANGQLDKGLCQIMLVVSTNANNCYCNLITVCKKDMLMFVSVICMLVRIA